MMTATERQALLEQCARNLSMALDALAAAHHQMETLNRDIQIRHPVVDRIFTSIKSVQVASVGVDALIKQTKR